jgi:hypothetical protein
MKIIIYLVIFSIVFINQLFCCTSFAIKTESGTILAKNRDASYSNKQSFQRIKPINQFTNWYNNNLNHNFEFYALVADNDIKMGVNQNGLAAIEEDPIFPDNHKKYRRYLQPIYGNAEGMVLFGILQNFTTIDEMLPSIDIIFSHAAPNFYQIADKDKILIVEVAFADNDNELVRKYNYQIINTKNSNYAHTNNYLSSKFNDLNQISEQNKLKSSNYRLITIKNLLNEYDNNIDSLSYWFFNTKSNLKLTSKNYTCLNSSIFRSNIGNKKYVSNDIDSNDIYGSVSNMIVINNEGSSQIIVRIIDQIKVKRGKQVIYYRELKTNLANLFDNKFKFTKKSFIRVLPQNNNCI